MGMSASQVRFLSLQSRKHDIGRQLTALSNKKMALSRDMTNVSRNYNNAMNQKTLKWSNDSGATYQSLTYDMMMKPNLTNSTVPYIVSTRDGKVVVDNTGNLLSGLLEQYPEYADYFGTDGASYLDIAQLISTYQDDALGIKGGSFTTSADNVVSGTANKGAYVIPDGGKQNYGFGYENSLRMKCLQKAGVIKSEDIAEYKSILEQLYGTNPENASKSMEEWLLEFDKSGTTMIDLGTPESPNKIYYSSMFGSLNDSGNWSLEGGSALGNLALAKAYQKEYQVYLNTPVEMGMFDVSGDDENPINKRNDERLKDAGVSKRINSLIDTKGTGSLYEVLKNFTMSEDTFDVLINNTDGRSVNEGHISNPSDYTSYFSAGFADKPALGFQTTTQTGTYATSYLNANENRAQWDHGITVWADDVDLESGIAKNTNNSMHISDLKWASLYDFDGTLSNGTSADFAVGLSLNLFKRHYNDQNIDLNLSNSATDDSYTGRYRNSIDALVKDYAKVLSSNYAVNGEVKTAVVHNDSMMTVQQQALAYAQDMTYKIFCTTDSNNSDSASGGYRWVQSAGARANENFGIALNRESDTHWRYYSVNMTNLMNVFNTFYNMYIDSAMTYISEGKELNPNVHSKYGNYDTRILKNTLNAADDYGLKGTQKSFMDTYKSVSVQTAFDNLWDEAKPNTFKYVYEYNSNNVLEKNNKKGYFEYNGHLISVSCTSNDGLSDHTNNKITYSYFEEDESGNQHEVSYTESYDATGNQTITMENGVTTTIFSTAKDSLYLENVLGCNTFNRSLDGYKCIGYSLYSGANSDGETKNYVSILFKNNNGEVITLTEYGNLSVKNDGKTTSITGSLLSEFDSEGKVDRIVINGNNDAGNVIDFQEFKGYNSDKTENYVSLPAGDRERFMNKESTLTTEYHYKNDYTGLEYDLYCHGDNEGHADVLKSYKLGDYANKKGYNGIATSIIVFPEDKYGHQIDELVKTCQARVDDLYNQLEACFAHKSKIIDYFDAIFQRISENGWQLDSKVNNGGNNADYLNNKLQNNEYFVTVCSDRVDRTGYNFVNKMASSVMKIFEVADDNKQNEAMSKFEAEKTRISNKERKIDLIMKKLETEQEAINTEMDAVQKVENENISKTFKMFA